MAGSALRFSLIRTDFSVDRMKEAFSGGGMLALLPLGSWIMYKTPAGFAGKRWQGDLVTGEMPAGATLEKALMVAQRWSAACQLMNEARKTYLDHPFNKSRPDPTRPGRTGKTGWYPNPRTPLSLFLEPLDSETGENQNDRVEIRSFGFWYTLESESGFEGQVVQNGVVSKSVTGLSTEAIPDVTNEWAEACGDYVRSLVYLEKNAAPGRLARILELQRPKSDAPKGFDPAHRFDRTNSCSLESMTKLVKLGGGIQADYPFGSVLVWEIDGAVHGEILQFRARTGGFAKKTVSQAIKYLTDWIPACTEGFVPEP